MKSIYIILASGILAAGAACGDDDGNGNGNGGSNARVDTGLPESTELQDVTAAQYEAVCDSVRDTLGQRFGAERMTRALCELQGAALEDEPAVCREAADQCVTDVQNDDSMFFTTEDADVASDFECGEMSGLEGCDVTIGEFETCLNDTMTAVDTALAAVACDNAANVELTDVLAGDNLLEIEQPSSCQRLETNCPGTAAIGPGGG